MKIGHYRFSGKVVAAPMAGISDRPFRKLSRRFGATLAVSEMVHADPRFRHHSKTRCRVNHIGECRPISVQLVGTEPRTLAESARYNVDHGADIIDINMGCPAKKVCNKQAGSALLGNETLVAEILDAVVKAVNVPVTLKIRTGPSPTHRNGVRIANLAQDLGIQALAIHGRTRACKFKGHAEYETIKLIKAAVKIPVIANGDIIDENHAKQVLSFTGADAVMVGRAAQGNPWLFGKIDANLQGKRFKEPEQNIKQQAILEHCEDLYSLYGEEMGVRVARKHIRWYIKEFEGGEKIWSLINRVETAKAQQKLLKSWFQNQAQDRLVA